MLAGRLGAAYLVVRILLTTLGGGLAGAGLGFLFLAGERCGGPACAGLVIIPIISCAAGAAAGFLGGTPYWIYRRTRLRREASWSTL